MDANQHELHLHELELKPLECESAKNAPPGEDFFILPPEKRKVGEWIRLYIITFFKVIAIQDKGGRRQHAGESFHKLLLPGCLPLFPSHKMSISAAAADYGQKMEKKGKKLAGQQMRKNEIKIPVYSSSFSIFPLAFAPSDLFSTGN